MTRDCPPEDLIILCGDLNEDSHVTVPKDSADMIDCEIQNVNYKRMISELSNNGEFELVDIMHVSRRLLRILVKNILLHLEASALTMQGRSSL